MRCFVIAGKWKDGWCLHTITFSLLKQIFQYCWLLAVQTHQQVQMFQDPTYGKSQAKPNIQDIHMSQACFQQSNRILRGSKQDIPKQLICTRHLHIPIPKPIEVPLRQHISQHIFITVLFPQPALKHCLKLTLPSYILLFLEDKTNNNKSYNLKTKSEFNTSLLSAFQEKAQESSSEARVYGSSQSYPKTSPSFPYRNRLYKTYRSYFSMSQQNEDNLSQQHEYPQKVQDDAKENCQVTVWHLVWVKMYHTAVPSLLAYSFSGNSSWSDSFQKKKKNTSSQLWPRGSLPVRPRPAVSCKNQKRGKKFSCRIFIT